MKKLTKFILFFLGFAILFSQSCSSLSRKEKSLLDSSIFQEVGLPLFDSTQKSDSTQSFESSLVDTTFEDYQTGNASWYGLGDGYHGKRTASGIIFDTYTWMAAHKTLAFGTIVRVTNLQNGKSTIVKIVDRGPFVKGRIIDLSYYSKNEIGMGGIAKVKLEIVKISNSQQEINPPIKKHFRKKKK